MHCFAQKGEFEQRVGKRTRDSDTANQELRELSGCSLVGARVLTLIRMPSNISGTFTVGGCT